MINVSLKSAYRLLNHGPTILVSAHHNDIQNVMAAAWACALDFDPPKITVVIDKSAYTRELIEAAGTFAINVPCVAQVDIVRKVGTTSGRDMKDTDKFAEYGLETFSATEIDAPLLKGCVAWLECKLITELHNQNTYDLFIAEVVAAHADERVFSDGHWHFEGHDELRTIHHIAGGAFFATGVAIQA
ncbi:MAG: flavin reductase family protein [Gammaproteobacteria bacterium]|nr:flavin reductase family protein [Gammaproteobacteria bacterium]